MFQSKKQNQLQVQDQVDGGFLRKKQATGNDSAYNTDDESHSPETHRKPGKSKKSKVKKQAITELMTSLVRMDLQDHGRNENGAGSIQQQTVKLRAETSRTNDCQLRVDFLHKIDTLPKTSKSVYPVIFDGRDNQAESTTHLWQNYGTVQENTYVDLRFSMKGPSTLEESPREPTPIEEEPTPGEGERTPEEEPSAPEEEEGRNDEVDADQEASSDDDKYNYRLARVVNDTRVVAIHEDDVDFKEDGKNVFSIQWKVELGADTFFTLRDPVEQPHSYNNLILAVTTTEVHMITVNEHANTLQNPNTKIGIWSV